MNIDENIFVSIASFRDVKCINTLKNIYYNSDNPDNIYCGIFTQTDNNNEKEQCYDPYFQYNSNVRRMLIDYKNAKGPLWARVRIIKNLYQNEKYFLMIDAHTKLVKGWDTELKKYIKFLKGKGISKPIISTYPQNSIGNQTDTNKISNESLLLCRINSGNNYPKVLQSVYKTPGYFYKSYLISANFLFCEASFLNNIDINKLSNLSYIFSGEEYLFAVLAFVNGYDIYNSPNNIIYHEYKSSKDKIKDNTDWYKLANINYNNENESYKNLEKLLTTNLLDNVRKTKDLLNIVKGNNNNFQNIDHLCNLNEKIKYV
jgi:hypothetical protein